MASEPITYDELLFQWNSFRNNMDSKKIIEDLKELILTNKIDKDIDLSQIIRYSGIRNYIQTFYRYFNTRDLTHISAMSILIDDTESDWNRNTPIYDSIYNLRQALTHQKRLLFIDRMIQICIIFISIKVSRTPNYISMAIMIVRRPYENEGQAEIEHIFDVFLIDPSAGLIEDPFHPKARATSPRETERFIYRKTYTQILLILSDSFNFQLVASTHPLSQDLFEMLDFEFDRYCDAYNFITLFYVIRYIEYHQSAFSEYHKEQAPEGAPLYYYLPYEKYKEIVELSYLKTREFPNIVTRGIGSLIEIFTYFGKSPRVDPVSGVFSIFSDRKKIKYTRDEIDKYVEQLLKKDPLKTQKVTFAEPDKLDKELDVDTPLIEDIEAGSTSPKKQIAPHEYDLRSRSQEEEKKSTTKAKFMRI